MTAQEADLVKELEQREEDPLHEVDVKLVEVVHELEEPDEVLRAAGDERGLLLGRKVDGAVAAHAGTS